MSELEKSVAEVEDELVNEKFIELVNRDINPRYIEDEELKEKYEELCQKADEIMKVFEKKGKAMDWT